jgi:hypothetical protein
MKQDATATRKDNPVNTAHLLRSSLYAAVSFSANLYKLTCLLNAALQRVDLCIDTVKGHFALLFALARTLSQFSHRW